MEFIRSKILHPVCEWRRLGLQETLHVCPGPYDGILMFLKTYEETEWMSRSGDGRRRGREKDRENGKRGKKGRCPKGLRFPDLTHDLTLSTVTLPPRG